MRTFPTRDEDALSTVHRKTHVRAWISDEGQNLFPANVILGTDDSNDTTGFTAVATGAPASSTSQAWQGSRSLEVVLSGTGDGVRTNDVAVTASTLYTASVYLRASTGRLSVDVYLRDTTNNTNGTTRTVWLRADRWTRVVVSHTMGAGNVSCGLYVEGNSAGTLYADGFKLEQRAYASNWTDAEQASDTNINLCDLLDFDWVEAVEWGEAVDAPHLTASVTLAREQATAPWCSLAPLKTNSPCNAAAVAGYAPDGYSPAVLVEGRLLWIEVQIRPLDTLPDPDETWSRVFEGRIDTVDVGEAIKVDCRSRDAWELVDCGHIEEEYPEPAGLTGVPSSWYDDLSWPLAVETFMQAALDSVTGGGWTLATVGTPSWNLNDPAASSPLVRKMPVHTLLQQLAEMAGREVRFRWDDSDSRFELQFFEPESSDDLAQLVLGDDEYEVTSLKRTAADVRNSVAVTFTNATSYDRRDTVVREDSSSISRFGRRHCAIIESSASNVNTTTEGNKLGDFVLNACKEPFWDATVTLGCHPFVVLGDGVTLEAVEGQNPYFDASFGGAVVGIRHRVGPDADETELVIRKGPTAATVMTTIGVTPRIAAPGVGPVPGFASVPHSTRARVYLSANQTIGGDDPVLLDTVDYDRSGVYFELDEVPSDLYGFVTPYAGIYRIGATLTMDYPGATGARFRVWVEADGVEITGTAFYGEKANATAGSCMTTIALDAGVKIRMWAFEDTAGTVDAIGGIDRTFMEIERIR